MTQCYGSCAKSVELAAMSSAFQDWGPSASLEKVRSDLWDWIQSQKPVGFEDHALALFRWQASQNQVYKAFVNALAMDPNRVNRVEDIPCMPVEFFKTHTIKTGNWETERVFRSSGTSQAVSRSQHHLDSQGSTWYSRVAQRGWESQWNSPVNTYSWLGLLPGYLGREDASLLHMVSDFMTLADGSDSGMLMHDHDALMAALSSWAGQKARRPLILFGVTWAVLDWVEALRNQSSWLNTIPWNEVTLVDTGGMKGRAVEPVRSEVHATIRAALPKIHLASEYGMTEMMSQGYAMDGMHQRFPVWVKPIVREARDPRAEARMEKVGRLDVIDLANAHSCAFLATKDLAKMTHQGLVLLGRQDNAEVRGCSLLAAP